MEPRAHKAARARRQVPKAMLAGATGHCPACGSGRLFARYLKVADQCAGCGEEMHHQRADDLPPYFTIFLVGHLLVPLVLWVEKAWHPDIAVHMAIWLPLAIALSLSLLPVVKGAVVGLQWALYMHGFAVTSEFKPHAYEDEDVADKDTAKTWTT